MRHVSSTGAAFALILLVALSFARTAFGGNSGEMMLWPGETFPLPRQRGLNEVEVLPYAEAPCPVCGRIVAIPEVDKLMRRPSGFEGELKWRMHAVSRDADLCPYPAEGKISFQADVVICPDCGYAAHGDRFANPVPEKTAAWARDTLRPNLRAMQVKFLGKRSIEMSEQEIIDFFAQQGEIPDNIRTEHYRVVAAAMRTPYLEQAEATWLAAWALRRESAGPPKGEFLAKRAAAVEEAQARAKTSAAGLAGKEEALRHLLGKNRSGKERLVPGEKLAARVCLAGVHIRAGRMGEAYFELDALLAEFRERFLRPEQDPLWGATSSRASRVIRLNDLERIRNEAESEVVARMDMVKSEIEHLDRAANLIRQAMLAGELDGNAEQALFYAYLVGEFLRRAGHLAMAAEWFKNLDMLAAEASSLDVAAGRQMAEVREQAGETINLLSALGHDGEALVKLREICAAALNP